MKRWLLGAVLLTSAMIAAGPALAAVTCTPVTTNWTGGGDGSSWNDSNNWDSGVPGACATANLNSVSGATVNFPDGSSTGVTSPQLSTVTVDGVMTLQIQVGNTLNDDMIVGDTGTGTVNNTGTQNVTGNLILGNQSTGNGTYTITGNSAQTNVNFVPGGNGPSSTNGGNPNPNGALIIGEYGTGTFTQGMADQSDPLNQVNIAGDLSIGHQGTGSSPPVADSVGTYTLNTGTLTVGGSIGVGGASTGNNVFNQLGGTVNITGSAASNSDYVGVGTSDHTGELFLGGAAGGNNDGGNGTYNMTGGTLTANVIEDGHTGIGIFNQSLGTVNANFALWLGNAGGSNGTYNFTGGSINAGSVDVALFGNGTFSQSAGTTLSITNELDVGFESGQGTFTLGGGSVTSGTTIIGDGTGNGCCGVNVGGSGTLNVTAGSLSTGAMTVGIFAQGTVNQSGGTVGATSLTIASGGSSAQPVDTYNLTGSGILNVTGNETVGVEGNGNFVQGTTGDAGATQNNVTGTLFVGNAFDGLVTPDGAANIREGSYTLNTGTLNTGETDVGTTSIGSFTQNGGTHNTNLVILGDQNLQPLASGCGGTCTTGGPAPGTYTMNGGALNINGDATQNNFGGSYPSITGGTGLIVGNAGTGVFNQFGASTVTSGTPQVANTSAGTEGDLVIGAQGPSAVAGAGPGTGQGTYNLGQTGQLATPSLSVNGSIIIGRDAGSNGATVPGASPTNPNLVIQGDGTNLSVFYNGGGIANANPLSSDIMVGLNGNGAVTQTDKSTVYMDGDLSIGINQGAIGSYNLSATSNGGNLQVGNFLNIGGVGGSVNCCSEQTAGIGGTGYFTQTSGDVTVVQTVFIGNNGGTGTYAMSGGTLTANLVDLGTNGGTGTFNLSGGTVNDDMIVGDTGTGTFNNTGGTDNVTGNLTLGNTSSGNGTYNLNSGGTLSVSSNMTVGNAGTGTYTQGLANQSDASLNNSATVSGSVDIGSQTASTGTLTLNNGTLTVTGNMTVGDAGTGNLNVNGGTLGIGSILGIGINGTGTVVQTGGIVNAPYIDMSFPSGSGTSSYTISNGTLNVGDLNLGLLGTGSATFTQNGGIVNVTDPGGALFVNNNSGFPIGTNAQPASPSNYFMNNGALNVANNLNVGGGGAAFFTQTGGGVTIGTSTTNSTNTQGIGNLFLGVSPGDNGTYTMSAGTLTVYSNASFFNASMEIGQGGGGTFNQTGGIVNTYGANGFAVGDCAACGGSGSYNISGGSLTVNANTNVIGQSGNGFVGTHELGTMTQSGGATVSIAANLFVGYDDPATTGSFYTLGGTGSLTIGTGGSGDLNIGTQNGASGTFNFNTALNDSAQLIFGGTGQNLVVGDGATGVFNEGSITNHTDLNLQTSGTTLDIGRSVGGTGTFNLAPHSTLEDDMIVGDAGTGTFNNNTGTNTVGTTLAPANLIIGNQSTGIGTYNNNGGSNTINGNLTVGSAGTGTYNLGNGDTGATLNVNGSGLSGGTVVVGRSGTGTVTASNLATATVAGSLFLGGESPGDLGNGTLTVTGFGTKWTNEQQVLIGGAGTGTLKVLAGGYFESDPGTSSPTGTSGVIGVLGPQDVFGGDPTANGFATVDGSSSEWNNKGALRVGEWGDGTLTISNGGLVVDNAGTDGAAASVGWKAGSTGTVTVSNFSTWTNNGDLVVGDAGTGTVTMDSTSTITITGLLDLGKQSTGVGTFNLNGGTLTDDLIVGDAGMGTFNNTGGLHTVNGNLILGNQAPGGNGTYNLTAGGTTSVSGFTFVGAAGQGTFLNDNSTHTTADLVLGQLGGSSGQYTLQNNGILTVTGAGFFDIGEHGTGTFTQTSGTTTVGGAVDLGRCGGAGCLGGGDTDTGVGNGTATVSGGSFSVGAFMVVGDSGVGQFNQSKGSTVTVTDDFDVGRGATGQGTYSITDTAQLTVGGTIDVGFGSTANSTFTQSGTSVVNANGPSGVIVGDAGQGTYTLNTGSTLNLAGNLTLGNTSTGNGSFILDNTASLNFTGSGQTIYVGLNGTGVFTQNAGDLNINTLGIGLQIGVNAGSNGTYNLNSGASLEDSLIVGDAGTGTFNNSSGSHTVTGDLILGNQSTGNGTYTLSGTGSLTVTAGASPTTGTIYDGASGTGTFTQTGTTTVSAVNISVGNNSGGIGEYGLSGSGTVTLTGTLFVGGAGTGTFNQSGSTTVTAAELSVANNASGVGTYNLSGGSLTIFGDTFIAGDTLAQGQFSQTGGTATLANVFVGYAGGATGKYLLGDGGTAGSLSIGGNLDIGTLAGSNGYFDYNVGTGGTATLAFTTSGSTMTVGDSGFGQFDQGGGDLNLEAQGVTLDIGAQKGGTGQYIMTGGSLEDSLIVGDAGVGTFSNTGGTHTVSGTTGALIIGNQSTGVGTYTLGGTGNLTLSDAGAQVITGNATGASGTFQFNINPGDTGTITLSGTGDQIIVGQNGAGVFNQGGGDLNLTGAGATIDIAANSTSFGQYNMSGGSLEAPSLNVGDAGHGQFNQSGGSVTLGTTYVSSTLLTIGNQANAIGSSYTIGGAANPSLTDYGSAIVGNDAEGTLSISPGATVDIKGSMTIANSAAGGGVGMSGGSLTVGDGGSGNQLLITGNGNMKIEDSGGLTPVGATVTVDGALTNNGELSLGLHDTGNNGPSLTVTQGLQNNNSFNFLYGVLNANVTNNAGAVVTVTSGLATTLNGNLTNYSSAGVTVGGIGTALTQTGNLTNGSLTNSTATVTVENSASYSVTNVDNYGVFSVSANANPPHDISAVSVGGTLTNETGGTMNISGNGNPGQGASMTVAGAATNNGTINVSNAVVKWNGSFTNNGAYISDPSANYFTDLTIGPGGYLTGGAGDLFSISGNFINNTNSALSPTWNTSLSTVDLTGTGTHELALASADMGAVFTGYTDNFAIGDLQISLSDMLTFQDGANVSGPGALYVSLFDLLNGTSLADNSAALATFLANTDSAYNIYYNPTLAGNAWLGDLAYTFGAGGGELIPIGGSIPPPPPSVPEPPTWILFVTGFCAWGLFIQWRRRRVGQGL